MRAMGRVSVGAGKEVTQKGGENEKGGEKHTMTHFFLEITVVKISPDNRSD